VVERYIYTGIVLGVGNQTSVLEVEDKVDGKRYAMKKIHCTTQDFEMRKTALQREVEVMEHLSHKPHTPGFDKVTTFIRAHSDDTKQLLYLILSPVAEKSLREVFSNKSGLRLHLNHDYHLMFQDLADGLSYIHESTVRHKDIKPENILVHKGRLMYADFGISRIFEGESGTTKGPTTDFTIPYAAPEVLAKLPRNEKSDVFCLGAVFYEILGNYVGVLELQDTCHGSSNFRGYGTMAKNDTLKQKIQSARSKYLHAEDQQPLWEQALLAYLAVIESMLLVAENERPNAKDIALEVRRIRNQLEPRYFSRPGPDDSGRWSLIGARRIY
jgi:serine/threonine protein kinase